MKIAILTTQTPHHAWFVLKLKEIFPDIVCVDEQTNPSKPDPFDQERLSFEKKHFFSGSEVRIGEICETLSISSVNDTQTKIFLEKSQAQVLVDFGTGKVAGDLIGAYENRILNLHGGDPEKYRGLDSHLWAVFHSDWNALTTTIHRLDHGLDTGEIIQKSDLPYQNAKRLVELRAINTDACVKLTVGALETYARWGKFLASKQTNKGRYYSGMPAELKIACAKKFEKFLQKHGAEKGFESKKGRG